MIIVEGLDHSGKTTTAEKISERLQVPRLPSKPPPREAHQSVHQVHSQNQLTPHEGIRDRVYAVSELVYGTVLRGGPHLEAQHRHCVLDLMCRPYLLIYCRPSDQWFGEQIGSKPEMDGVSENWPQLLTAYDSLMFVLRKHGALRVWSYNWETDPEEALYRRVDAYWKDYAEWLRMTSVL